MKVMIIGSMRFAAEMLEAKKILSELGHTVDVPCDTDLHVEDPALRDDFVRDAAHVKENDILAECFNLLAGSDAIVILNHKHNGIDGYIGASALMEIGVAYYLGKKIFLLNPVSPTERYRHELDIVGAICLDGDLRAVT